MRGNVVPVIFKINDNFCKNRITEKITGKKEGSFYLFLLQCADNKITTVCKLMPGKNKGYFFLCTIPSNDSPMTILKASCTGGCYFFGLLPASFAASK